MEKLSNLPVARVAAKMFVEAATAFEAEPTPANYEVLQARAVRNLIEAHTYVKELEGKIDDPA